MPRPKPNYDQTKAREHLKSMSTRALRALATQLEIRLAGIEKCVPWPALRQVLARDIKAVHDEIRFKENLESVKAKQREGMEHATLWNPSKGPWKNK